MPWKETDVSEQRRCFVVEALGGSESISSLCRRYGVSRKTGYKWLQRYREVGDLSLLAERSRRPRFSPRKTPDWLEERVLAIRAWDGWGGRKIAYQLRQEGFSVARSTVDRILKRRGAVQPRRPESQPAVQRFERARPNELSQMDFKGYYRLSTGRRCYPLSILDDHSRFAQGLYALPSEHGRPVQECLTECWKRYGVPQALLCDHGQPWWGTSNGHGLTRLSVFAIRQGIVLIYGRVRHPQTQGKVERFHRTLHQALSQRSLPKTLPGFQTALDEFRQRYNEKRPHEAIGDRPPAEAYRPSRQRYDPDPPPWQYPEGAEVRTVRGNGCLHLERRDWFVCQALEGRRVRCQRFEDKILVTYRHMHVRVIDPGAGRTTPVVRPAWGTYL